MNVGIIFPPLVTLQKNNKSNYSCGRSTYWRNDINDIFHICKIRCCRTTNTINGIHTTQTRQF